jgi:hypothetical protein
MSRVWLLNLDADREMGRPLGYVPSVSMVGGMSAWRAQLRASLCGLQDYVLDDDDVSALNPEDHEACAWCPTPTALKRLDQGGWRLPEHPSFDVVRRVNHRRFCAELGQTLEHAAFLSEGDHILDHVGPETQSGWWLLKRPFGFSGKGRRRVRCGRIEPSDRAWIDASLKHGDGLQVEPWVERDGDFVVHGRIEKTGVTQLGCVCVQVCDARGAWQQTTRIVDGVLSSAEQRALLEVAEATASTLSSAGYFGPFGIDSYRYHHGRARRMNPRSEINARYTMGWAVGMASPRLPR